MSKIKLVNLPKDNGPHNFGVEWWYFNGHLKDSKGGNYSFMDCLFKVDISKVGIPHFSHNIMKGILHKNKYIYFAHSVVIDIANNKNYKEIQDFSIITPDSFKEDLLFVNYKNAKNPFSGDYDAIIETKPNNFLLKNKNLILNLENTKKPMLEGGHGYVGTPKSGSYYYSFTDMKVSGSLDINNKKLKVKGMAWMDHQWANAVYKKDKWTWFSFQLDNGMQIMCVEYEKSDGTDILVDVLFKNGEQKQFKKAILVPGKENYKSKKTKAVYPLSWIIDIGEANIKIQTKALVKNQEMIFGQINYWEGPMKVLAIIDGKKVKGLGFMELVGYPSDYNYLVLEGERIKDSIVKSISKMIGR